MSYRATTLASYIPRSYISSNAILNILPDASKHDLFPFKSFFNSFPKLVQGALVTLLKKKEKKGRRFFRKKRRNEVSDGIVFPLHFRDGSKLGWPLYYHALHAVLQAYRCIISNELPQFLLSSSDKGITLRVNKYSEHKYKTAVTVRPGQCSIPYHHLIFNTSRVRVFLLARVMQS